VQVAKVLALDQEELDRALCFEAVKWIHETIALRSGVPRRFRCIGR